MILAKLFGRTPTARCASKHRLVSFWVPRRPLMYFFLGPLFLVQVRVRSSSSSTVHHSWCFSRALFNRYIWALNVLSFYVFREPEIPAQMPKTQPPRRSQLFMRFLHDPRKDSQTPAPGHAFPIMRIFHLSNPHPVAFVPQRIDNSRHSRVACSADTLFLCERDSVHSKNIKT